jgi:hypothetical protein
MFLLFSMGAMVLNIRNFIQIKTSVLIILIFAD